MRAYLTALLLAFSLITPVAAQTIYPLDRAEILAGSVFDLKVEFPAGTRILNATVKINGEDASKVLGHDAKLTEYEDGADHAAYWIKRVSLPKAGRFTVEAAAGNTKATATWEVFDTPKGRVAKNVILFIGDGMSMAHRTAARILAKGMVEGRYGGELAIDDMPAMALVSTAGSDSVVTDSANSMSAYTTGHKTCVNAMGVYCAANTGLKFHPSVENLTELTKRRLGLAVGVVTNTEIEDATPAAMVAHTRRRTQYDDIVQSFYELQPEVIMGGGSPNFLPAATDGGKRADNQDYVAKLRAAGYAYARTNAEMLAASADPATRQLLGLFNKLNIDGALDRKFLKKGTVPTYPDQPDLTDQVRSALQVLSRNDKGFLLMVESGRIDKYSHSLDWERAVYDTIMLDNAVKVAKGFAADRNDTLIIVVADHAHPISIIGTYDDAAGTNVRDKLQLYDKAKFPNYATPDAEGYPPAVDVSRRLAVVFAAFPDHCDAGRPYLEGENIPAVAAGAPPAKPPAAPTPADAVATVPASPKPASVAIDDKTPKVAVANEANCQVPGVARRMGNLPFTADRGIHSGDDVILTAMGPGSEQFHGRIDNTRVFRAIAVALGLAP